MMALMQPVDRSYIEQQQQQQQQQRRGGRDAHPWMAMGSVLVFNAMLVYQE